MNLKTIVVSLAIIMTGLVIWSHSETPPAPPPPQLPAAPDAPAAPQPNADRDELIRRRMEMLRQAQGATNAAPAAPAPPAPGQQQAPPALPATPPSPGVPATPPPQPSPATPQTPAAPPAQVPPVPGAPAAPDAQPSAPPVSPTARAAAAEAREAKPAKPGEPVITKGTIDFRNMDLFQALDVYAELVNRTILRPTTLQNTPITLKTQTDLTRTEAIQALDTVLALNGITMIPVGEKFVKVVPITQAGQEAAAFSDIPANELPEADQFITHVVQLKFAIPSEMVTVLTPFQKNPGAILPVDSNQVLVLRDYAANVKRMLELIQKIDIEIPQEVTIELIPIKYALAADVSAVLGTLTTGGAISAPRTTAGRTTTGTSTIRPAGAPAGFPGQGVTPGQPQTGLQSGATTGISRGATPTTATSAAAAAGSFQERLQQIVQRASRGTATAETPLLGDAKIIPDDRSNSLLVFANKTDMAMIKQIIAKIDIVAAQVLLEAIILEVNLGDNRALGVSMSQNQHRSGDLQGAVGSQQGSSSTLPFSFINPNSVSSLTNFPGGFNYFGKVGRDFDFVLSATASDSRVNVLSRPRIQTSHAMPAEIFVGETRPIATGSFTDFSGLPRVTTAQTEIGIRLTVLPLINPDGLVVLEIAQTVDQVGEDIPISPDFSQPAIIKRTATSKVAVNDKETIILGGFISTEKRKTKSGVPYLKDVWLLGRLFSSQRDELNKTELIILIRPTVLPTPEVASEVAQQERDKLAEARKAESEIEERDRKIREKIERDMERKRRE